MTLDRTAQLADNLGMYAIVGSLVYELWERGLILGQRKESIRSKFGLTSGVRHLCPSY